MNIIDELKEIFFPDPKLIPSGVHHFQSPPDQDTPYRLHLRIEKDGESLLIVNASTVLHLNQTATEYAYHLVKKTPQDEIATRISRRYRVGKSQALADFQDFKGRIETLISTPDLDPTTFLDFERKEPYSGKISAPYRLDCALTYRVTEGINRNVAPIDRVKRELSFEEWKIILEKAWNAGIPHIIFTGGEPTLRPDLPDLIAYTEQLGQVVGVLTDGLRLSEPKFLHELLQSGLDHLMICLNPKEEQSWEALRDVLAEDIFTTVHLTLTKNDPGEMIILLDRLSAMGVTSLSLSVSDMNYKESLKVLQQAAADRHFSLVWDLPVPYSDMHPVALEIAEEEEAPLDGAGKAWLYVEPDGDVLACQGHPDVMGNLLTDPWEKIWETE
jgi:hypothetical protein